MSVIAAQSGAGAERPTLASTWWAISGGGFTGELLAWPPDVFALTNVLLDRSEAFRFALSPPAGVRWPPAGAGDWSDAVVDAGREWSAWVEDRRGSVPSMLAEEWGVALERADLPLADLAEGRDWRVCTALLSLHAIADEACAGLGSATERADGRGAGYRARARELLARTGSLARIAPRRVRVLPKVRTPPTGRPAFSRYACVQGAGLEASWHKMPTRHLGTDPRAEYVNLLLLPWPLRVRESDFRPVEGSVQRLERDPFGFFEFAPSERLDLDLVDRVLTAALDEADDVDVVVLPESAVDESEIDELEAVLDRHGVVFLTAGVRQRSAAPGRLPRNWVHTGVNPRLRKGEGPPDGPARRWFHIRQNKHHRWALDESQIYQYHLAGALHPHVRWWEAMEVPARSLQFVSVGEEITIVSLVCEDLAETDQLADCHPVRRPHRRLHGIARRTAPGIPVGGPVCERARGRPRVGGPHADLVRDGAAEPAAGARDLSDRRAVEGRRARVPRDSARAGRAGGAPDCMRLARDPAHRRWPPARRHRDALLRCCSAPDPRLRRRLELLVG
jgi:hypothetical protein